jgi:uncharacterized protein (TIGR00730 family)
VKSVCVYCGSSSGFDPVYRDAATHLGRTLARRGLILVYGAGNVGLMGILAEAALTAGGLVTGVIPRFMVEKEWVHPRLTTTHVVGTMHERKALMADLADAFIALPGGFGTLEELAEILTWGQLHLHHKPAGLLNVNGFFDPLRAQLGIMIRDGFLKDTHADQLLVETDPDRLLDRLAMHQPVHDEKWFEVPRTVR